MALYWISAEMETPKPTTQGCLNVYELGIGEKCVNLQ